MNLNLKRTFSSDGRVDPEGRHFFVDPSPWNESTLIPSLLQRGSFTSLVAPSQTGKTTRVSSLLNKINNSLLLVENNVICIYIDMMTVVKEQNGLFKHNFFEQFILAFEMMTCTTPEFETFDKWGNLFSLESSTKWYQNKQIILILDEVDFLAYANVDERSAFLTYLRCLKQKSPTEHCLYSMLIITNYTGDYLIDHYGNSPFNPFNQLRAPYFDFKEVQELFQQYEKEYEVSISPNIVKYIYKQTEGAQGLTTIYGKCLHEWIQEHHGLIPSYSDWVNYTFSTKFFLTICRFSNYRKMSSLIRNDISATDTLLRILYRNYTAPIPESLIKSNILLSNGELSNPFTNRLVSTMLNPIQMKIQEERIVMNDQNQIDFLDLVCNTIRNINPLEILSAKRKSKNHISTNFPPGPKKSVYVWSFKKALDITFKNTVMTVYPEGVVPGLKSCDMIIYPLGQLIAVEHGADLNLDKNSNSSKSIYLRVKQKAEYYHMETNANQTWVINWTTVPKISKLPYYFPQSETVRTMYIYHDPIFSNVIVSTLTQQCEIQMPIIESFY